MEAKISKYQKFEAVTIHRSEIKNADYNPRKIADHAQKGLRKSLKQNGLVETLVWNKRTGNLVGGASAYFSIRYSRKNKRLLINSFLH